MSHKLLSTVLCNNVLIRRMGQRVCFQISIPKDVTRIVGVETSVRNLFCRALMPWQRDHPAGLLTLQAAGSANQCYSTHVKIEQSQALYTDLGYQYYLAGFWEWDILKVNTAMHSAHSEPDILDIPAPPALLCSYTDEWGPYMVSSITYRVSIHLWVTVNDLYNTPVPCTEQ